MPRRPLLALTLVAALALGACGDGGGGSDDGGSASAGVDASDDIAAAGPAEEGIDGVESFRIASRDHVGGDVAYPVLPPPGGPHDPVWANCGFYAEPIRQEHLVHGLEHGAVWLAYAPDLPAADVSVIEELAGRAKVVAAPYPDLADGEAVVATAWARQLRLDSVDDPRLSDFVVQYEDGSQAPEAGVTCTGTDIP
ncbi:MAG: DUF3105 domain-containing protein [Acidimicrobiales bacterium]